jgi:ABC-type transporter Mla subunit MlaD
MSQHEPKELEAVFSDPAIREFGSALRRVLRENDDYASLMDFEFAETPEAFADALRRFLRRYETFARRVHRRRPSETALENIARLADTYGVRLVRAALISHALCRVEREKETEGGEQ